MTSRSELNPPYKGALERVAAKAGLHPHELEKEIQKAKEGLEFTPHCLTLHELEIYPNLPKLRLEHVTQCNFCQSLAQAAEPGIEEVSDFVRQVVSLPRGSRNDPTLEEIERKYILETLERCNWNKAKAAQALGLRAVTLRRKVRQYHLHAKA